MANVYRENYINKVLEDADAGRHVDPERLTTAIQYLDDAHAVLQNRQKQIISKEEKRLAALNKDVDAELAAQGIVVTEEDLNDPQPTPEEVTH